MTPATVLACRRFYTLAGKDHSEVLFFTDEKHFAEQKTSLIDEFAEDNDYTNVRLTDTSEVEIIWNDQYDQLVRALALGNVWVSASSLNTIDNLF